jgi:hypothetical protein
VRADARTSAIERGEIYANMYFYQLLDAIKEDFPATFSVLGEVNFHHLITGYLVEYPPSDPSINEASRHLAEYAGKSSLLLKVPFIADSIRVERAIVEVFLGPDRDPLNTNDPRAVPATKFPSLRIGVHPATRLIHCRWRIDKVLRAVEQEQLVPDPAQRPAAILVWRTKGTVHHRALDDFERTAFEMIAAGSELSAVCEAIALKISEDASPRVVQRMLSRWLADGILVRAINS